MNEHRNMQRRIVQKEAVRLLSMLAQTFSVISRKNDQSIPIQALSFKIRDKTTDLRVREGDLAIVQPILILLAVRRRRPIRIVWIVQVHPQEEFVPYILSQPIQSNIRHHISGTFHLLKIRFLQTVEVEMVIVEIESLVQAEPRIQN